MLMDNMSNIATTQKPDGFRKALSSKACVIAKYLPLTTVRQRHFLSLISYVKIQARLRICSRHWLFRMWTALTKQTQDLRSK